MRVAIHQPQYWPWPPYVHKVMSADTFVYLDTVQFSKNGFQNRNQLKSERGPVWLTAPVRHHFGQAILETKVTDPSVLRSHFRTLEANYASTPGFQRWKSELQLLLETQEDELCSIVIAVTEWLLQKLGVSTRRVRASEIRGAAGRGSALVASICKSLGATAYLTGTGGLAYMDVSDFSRIRCRVWVQDWTAPVYRQAHPLVGFLDGLSALDLLLNCPDTAGHLIASAGRWRLVDA